MVLLVVLGLPLASVRSGAYVLFDNGATDWVVGSEDALRWDPDVWPSGGTLRWGIEDAPEWDDLFGSANALSDLVDDAPLRTGPGFPRPTFGGKRLGSRMRVAATRRIRCISSVPSPRWGAGTPVLVPG